MKGDFDTSSFKSDIYSPKLNNIDCNNPDAITATSPLSLSNSAAYVGKSTIDEIYEATGIMPISVSMPDSELCKAGVNDCFNSYFVKTESNPNCIDSRVPTGFITKDSGERVEYDSGMRRDMNTGKDRFDLIPIPMLKRLAGLYGRGAVKYGNDNWRLAKTEEEMNRFKESAFRHFMQWANGEVDEDHAMAVVFNLFGYETTKEKLSNG